MSQLFFPAAVWLNSVPLTDQGRSPISVSREEKFSENELATALKRRYFRGVKHTWSWSWTFLPDDDEFTIDGNAARSSIRELIGGKGKHHVLKFYEQSSDYREYSVFCDAYSEDLIRRDAVTGIFYWEVGISFVEI